MKTTDSLTLSSQERMDLLLLICKGVVPLPVQSRAAILLLSDSTQRHCLRLRDVAQKAACSVWMVTATRRRFVAGGVDAALFRKS